MDEREKLASLVSDPDLVKYFYLDLPADKLLDRLENLALTLTESQDAVPFNAQVKGYYGALDADGDPWILKPAPSESEIAYHRLCGLAYVIDHLTGTLAAPTTLVRIEGKPYRVTKVVKNSIQISSYDYLAQPYVDILRADLVNRWLFFDEDRNPNNYLVIHNKANRPFVVAIDYDKADLESDRMKITGAPDKFGWLRGEKTRFLTLLRPDYFQGVGIEVFEDRLTALMSIPEKLLGELSLRILSGYVEKPEALAAKVTSNILTRRAYINEYFRAMIKPAAQIEDIVHESDYSMFGSSFLNQYKDKK